MGNYDVIMVLCTTMQRLPWLGKCSHIVKTDSKWLTRILASLLAATHVQTVHPEETELDGKHEIRN